MNHLFVEGCQIVPAIMPVNLASGAQTGDWVSLKNYGRCTIVVLIGVGAAGQDPVLTLQQGKSVSENSPVALNFTRIDVKQASALTAVGEFTKIAQAAGNTYGPSDGGENQKLWVIDIKAEDLDIDGGYDCVRASLSDPGTNSQIGTALYILSEARHQQDPLPTAIAN